MAPFLLPEANRLVTVGTMGDVVSAYYRKNPTDLWTKIGEQSLPGLVSDALIGLAVTSHAQGTPATATFTDVQDRGEFQWSGVPVGSTRIRR